MFDVPENDRRFKLPPAHYGGRLFTDRTVHSRRSPPLFNGRLLIIFPILEAFRNKRITR